LDTNEKNEWLNKT